MELAYANFSLILMWRHGIEASSYIDRHHQALPCGSRANEVTWD